MLSKILKKKKIKTLTINLRKNKLKSLSTNSIWKRNTGFGHKDLRKKFRSCSMLLIFFSWEALCLRHLIHLRTVSFSVDFCSRISFSVDFCSRISFSVDFCSRISFSVAFCSRISFSVDFCSRISFSVAFCSRISFSVDFCSRISFSVDFCSRISFSVDFCSRISFSLDFCSRNSFSVAFCSRNSFSVAFCSRISFSVGATVGFRIFWNIWRNLQFIENLVTDLEREISIFQRTGDRLRKSCSIYHYDCKSTVSLIVRKWMKPY